MRASRPTKTSERGRWTVSETRSRVRPEPRMSLRSDTRRHGRGRPREARQTLSPERGRPPEPGRGRRRGSGLRTGLGLAAPPRPQAAPAGVRTLRGVLDTLRGPLKAAAAAFFVLGLAFVLLNPPSLSGAEGIAFVVAGGLVLAGLTAWAFVAMTGKDAMPDDEFERLVRRSEEMRVYRSASGSHGVRSARAAERSTASRRTFSGCSTRRRGGPIWGRKRATATTLATRRPRRLPDRIVLTRTPSSVIRVESGAAAGAGRAHPAPRAGPPPGLARGRSPGARPLAPAATVVATVYTIGHSTHETEAFVGLLAEHGVETLVDVRRYPGSRRVPWTNPGEIKATLPVHYRHLAGLGGRRPPAVDSPNGYWETTGPWIRGPHGDGGVHSGTRSAAGVARRTLCRRDVRGGPWWRCTAP